MFKIIVHTDPQHSPHRYYVDDYEFIEGFLLIHIDNDNLVALPAHLMTMIEITVYEWGNEEEE